MGRFLVGIDDTDYGESIGTGALSRELQILLMRKLNLTSDGVTRHQFLVHPDIPYTSHNSSACLALTGDSSVEEIAELCVEFIDFLFHPGADPGLCVATPGQFTAECLDFGVRAQRVVVKKEEAVELAAGCGIFLRELGGEGIGVIGALGGCALRNSGTDGRFISMRGIRDFEGEVPLSALLAGTEIDCATDADGHSLGDDDIIDTSGGVRPELIESRVVLPVLRIGDGRYRVVKRNKGDEK